MNVEAENLFAFPIMALLLLYLSLSLTIIDSLVNILALVIKLNLCGLPKIKECKMI